MKNLWMLFLLFSFRVSAQVGIGTTSPDTNTILDINSNSKGVLFPRLTDAQRDAIVLPVEGLFIYNLSSHDLQYYNGTLWMALSALPVNAVNFFMSEYCEGSSNNKYIEIYNPNNVAASLNGYEIKLHLKSSAGNLSTLSYTLSGIITANDVFVFSHSQATQTILDEADYSVILGFNGNDVVELIKNGVSIDVVGEIGNQPNTNTGWSVAGTANATFDRTLVRKPSFTGNTNWTTSAGTATTDSEWIVLAVDTFTGLGSHTP